MAEELDSLIISASVLDDFSDTLNELSRELAEVDAESEKVDPIKIDANVAKALAELEAVEQQLERIDNKDADPDVNVDQDPLEERVQAISNRGRGRMGELAMLGRGPRALGGGGDTDIDIDIDRRASRAIARNLGEGAGNVLGQTIGEAMDMPDLFEGRRGQSSAGKLFKEFVELRLFMSGMMNTLAALVPLFAVFAASLPAAIAGLGALAAAAVAAAGALGGPIALGAGAMMFSGGQLNVAEMQNELRRTLDTFLESFMPIMDALQPLVEGLFQEFRFLIRDLASRGRVLLSLTDEIGGAFQWLSQTIGPALEDFVRFGEASMPLMQLLVGGLASFDWFQIFASLLQQTVPLLDVLATQLVSILPAIFEISMGFFMVADAILVAFGWVAKVINAVDYLGEGFGILIGILLTAISATALYSVAVNSAFASLIGLAIQALPSVVGSLHSFIAGMTTASIATWTLIGAASILLGVLTFGLGPALSGIMGKFMGLGDGVGKATDELKRFQRQSNRISGPGIGGRSGDSAPDSGPAYGSNTNITIEAPDKETGNAAAHTLQFHQNTATTDKSNVEGRQHNG